MELEETQCIQCGQTTRVSPSSLEYVENHDNVRGIVCGDCEFYDWSESECNPFDDE